MNIRIPRHYSNHKQKQVIHQLISWAHEALKKKPQLLQKYKTRQYKNGSIIHTFERQFTLYIQYAERKSIGIETIGGVNEIRLTLPIGMEVSAIKPKHISKALAIFYKPFFESRLIYWNGLFSRPFNKLRIKYNSSNWGSCSSKGNINLSTRLLLCPLPVIDYVIVHELAHLIHPNHSKSFWAEVERVLPDYKTHARWIKTRGAHVDF